jgi:hypothetical protein
VLYFGAFNFLEARLPAALTEAAGEATRGAALGVFATCQFAGAFAGGPSAFRFIPKPRTFVMRGNYAYTRCL